MSTTCTYRVYVYANHDDWRKSAEIRARPVMRSACLLSDCARDALPATTHRVACAKVSAGYTCYGNE
eukprot:7300028-Prymnesium_polylepis.1